MTSKKVTKSFLYLPEKTKTKRPVEFETKNGPVQFNAHRTPERRTRAEFKAKAK